ncbi:MAG TPA: bifunctional precorrin-2 dehydrogenase/sirohydrochlorin ferrochelatase [Aggregatilineales bacterium]|nr:bifunctional precorrin-2 dehydrogenase/sirohydrochlorin ferrochelatase [Aggregatilineales bacterium]
MPLPVMLNVKKRRCVIVGGGKIGIRKAKQLLEEGAKVMVIGESLHETVPGVQHIAERYNRERLLMLYPFLVIAATSDDATNTIICDDAEAAGVLTMRMDNPARADVWGLIYEDRDSVTVAIRSGSPYLSRYLLKKFTDQLTPELVTLGGWMHSLRPHVKNAIEAQPERAALWKRIFESAIIEQAEAGDLDAAKAILVEIIGSELAQFLPE